MTQPTQYHGVYSLMLVKALLFRLVVGAPLILFWAMFAPAVRAQPASTPPGVSSPKPGIIWDTENNRFSADLNGIPLQEALQLLANATRWEIFYEPGPDEAISTRFQRLNPSEALPRIISNLNYALLPRGKETYSLFVYRTSVQEATTRLAPSEPRSDNPKPPTDGKIPNQLLVSLKPGSGAKIEDIAKALGAKITGKIDGLDTYRLEFEDDKAASAGRTKLESNDSIASVESNYSIPNPRKPELLSSSSTPPLNLKPRVNADGSRIIVGLIDTPVQSQSAAMKDFLLPALSVAPDPAPPSRELSHGTSMAETILRGISMTDESGKGSPVRILPIDVYGSREETSTFDVARGVFTAIKEGANIVNLSLGSYTDSAVLRQIVEQGHRQGVLFFGAAGNEPVTLPTYPAAYPEVVAVTAGDRSGRIANYANRGEFVDVMAPGAGVVQFNNRSYLGTGTSYATAYVTGIAAGIASEPGKSLARSEEEIRSRLGYRPPLPPPSIP